jgi:MiaB/RimO family radical SAM methylthiotransferase
VKNATSQKILYSLNKLCSSGKKLVVTGCMAGANQDLIEKYAPDASIVTTQNIESMGDAAFFASKGRKVILDAHSKTDRLGFFEPKEGVIAKIAVSDGCLSSCSFCETKFARGPLNSFSEKLILSAIERSVRMGAREIQLTSQDIGAYGIEKKTNVAELMQRISELEGFFKVRIGMLNPEHLGKYFDDFVEALKNEKFYKFVHIPVQSGSNKVLRDMRRAYTVGEFNDYVNELRRKIHDITVATDIIVGFPTETERDFMETLDFARITAPDVTNISRFGARPHASASKLEQHSYEVMNFRSNRLAKMVRSVQHEINDRFIGKKLDVIITESNQKSSNGRSPGYKQVVVADNGIEKVDMGSMHSVLINAASANVLYA